MHPFSLSSLRSGALNPILFILGPCVLESADTALAIATQLKRICEQRNVDWMFKASFDKANRSSIESYRGPGLEKGLVILEDIKKKLSIFVTTDIHAPEQATPVGQVCDMIQIPAFLCRQTDLLVAAGNTGKPVNIKKGQFLAPQDMRHPIAKVQSTGNREILLTERGTTFGYHNLVSDMRAIPLMQKLGHPVCYDGTHSVQLPSANETSSGGAREFIPTLVLAAVAAGADSIFLETHPEPEQAKSDSASMLPLASIAPLIDQCLSIRQAMRQVSVC